MDGECIMLERGIRIVPLVFCLVGFLFGIPSCAVNPVSGKQELMLLSETDEINLGRGTDLWIVQEYGLVEDQKLVAYLNDVCQRLGKISHRPNLDYHFKILDVPVVNAFAVLGGYVYFTRGILAVVNGEAELD